MRNSSCPARRVLMLLGSYDHRTHAGIARLAGERGWHLDVGVLKTFQLPPSWEGDGIIASLNANARLAQFVKKARMPVVDLSIWREDIALPRVAADNPGIGRLAARHFLSLGHSHFAWFAMEKNPVGQSRLQGFASELERHGHAVVRLPTGRQNRRRWERTLSRLPAPCAVFTKSDYDAAWLCSTALQLGRDIPEQLAVLGVDDNPLLCETQSVPLSSVRHDLERIGYEGARLLDNLMLGKPRPRRPALIASDGVAVRSSTDFLATSDPVVRAAIDFLRAHLSRPIGSAQIADAVGIGRRMLEIRFRRAMKRTLRETLLDMRLQYARSLLRNGSTVEDTSAQCGFCNAPHFSRTFKRLCGIPPSNYRKNHRQHTA